MARHVGTGRIEQLIAGTIRQLPVAANAPNARTEQSTIMQQWMTTQKDGTKNKAEIEISGVKERSEVFSYYL